jgi:prepilin-type processing-associated H-X9-DG protein
MGEFGAKRKFATAAFNVLELMVVVVVLAGLIVLVDVKRVKSQRAARILQCISNLKQLGVGMSLYEQAEDNRLPFAFIKYTEGDGSISWDSLIYPYASGESYGAPIPPSMSPDRLLRCPSDTIPADAINRKTGLTQSYIRRTYAMPRHSMTPDNWPPGPKNSTGVGLWWSDGKNQLAALDNLESINGEIPAVRLGIIFAPSRTLLLTEQAQTNNHAFSYVGATIRNPSDHLDTTALKMSAYHQGRFNYLMVDGHVETLFPVETVGKIANSPGNITNKLGNIWTINPDD